MTNSSKLSRTRIVALAVAGLGAAVAAASGCSGDDKLGGRDPGGIAPPGDGGGVAPCTDGATRSCSVTVGKQGDVLTCYEGMQTCESGTWGDCADGTIVKKRWVGGDRATASLGPPAPCVNNPCDPECQDFNEVPDGGIVTTEGGAVAYPWQTGSLGDMPPGLVNQGINEPCGDGSDCQFNMYCNEPRTDPLCAHSKCGLGVGMDPSCDSCVGMVCAADPSCCDRGPPFCGHSACDMGPPLGSSCDACTAAVCAADPSCCNTVWSAGCVAIAQTVGSCGCPALYPCNGPGERVGPNGHCYYYNSQDVAWTTARTRCRNRGPLWDMVTINDQAENDWVRNQITETIWIGYNDRASEGSFVWTSGQTPGYTNWRPGQPNNWRGNQDCTELCDSDNDCWYPSGQWGDRGCGAGDAYLCEYDGASGGAGGYCTGAGEVLGPNGHCYFFQPNDTTWLNARNICRARGPTWDLATIDDSAENLFIDNNLPSNEDYWIGLNDRASEGTYVWSSGLASTYTNWASGQPNNCCNTADCVELDNAGGAWNDTGCGYVNAYVCEDTLPPLPPPPNNWTQACVDLVATECDALCDKVNVPPNESGQCFPWIPGSTDPDCAGYDLAVGVPCDGPPTSVPVCNHGNTTVPAGIDLVHFAANSNQYPKCDPDLSHPSARTCTTTEPIPPGECIDVTGCLELAGGGMGNVGNREIVVNPVGSPNWVPECSCLDNWSLFSNQVSCGPPTCSGSSSSASFKPVNMYIVLDRSGSMSWDNRWTGAVAALTAFFQDPGSAGINIALEFFGGPSSSPGQGCACTGNPCSASQCTNHRCDIPYVGLGALTAQPMPADTQEQALVSALGAVSPNTWTPTYPAMDGALSWATGLANPAEIYTVILVTDGNPTTCLQGSQSATNTAIANLAGNAFNNFGVATYTIGMTGANIPALDQIAAQGGTGNAFVIGSGTASQVAADLLAALQAIAGSAVDCSFVLPNPGVFDPSNAIVTYTDGSGTTTALSDVGSAAGCGNGWYFSPDAMNPTSLDLCSGTCALVQSDPGASIDVNLGCPGGGLGSQTFNFEYQATCGQGQFPQWTFLTWDSTTPGDSSIGFRVRSADTQAGLASATFQPAGTAQAAPTDTQVCALSGPAPACPSDLYSALGGPPDAQRSYLELEVTVNPTSDGLTSATLNSWQVKHTCVDSL